MVALRIARALHKAIDPVSVLAYSAAVFAFYGPHNMHSAAVFAGAGVGLTMFARVSEYFLYRTPATVTNTPTEKADTTTRKMRKMAKKEAKMQRKMRKLDTPSDDTVSVNSQSVSHVDATEVSAAEVSYLLSQVDELKKKIEAAHPNQPATDTTVKVSVQETPAPQKPVQVGERHKS